MTLKDMPSDDTPPNDTPSIAPGPTTPLVRSRFSVRSVFSIFRSLLPGFLVALTIALLATLVSSILPAVGAPVIAILLGVLFAHFTRSTPKLSTLAPRISVGAAFTAKRVLQLSVVLFGLELSFPEVTRIGAATFPVLITTLVLSLALIVPLGRLLKVPSSLATLIGVGTAICGASAIAATSSVLDSNDHDISYAVATIFTFNVVAVLTFPLIGHLTAMSPSSFGLFAGTSINDVSSVVAAASVYSASALSYAIVVKLTRTLAIIPITLFLSLAKSRHLTSASGSPSHKSHSTSLHPTPLHPTSLYHTPSHPSTRSMTLRRLFPWFIAVFVLAVSFNSLKLVPHSLTHPISLIASYSITTALAAIGLRTNPKVLVATGHRPLLLGGLLWLAVIASSLVSSTLFIH